MATCSADKRGLVLVDAGLHFDLFAKLNGFRSSFGPRPAQLQNPVRERRRALAAMVKRGIGPSARGEEGRVYHVEVGEVVNFIIGVEDTCAWVASESASTAGVGNSLVVLGLFDPQEAVGLQGHGQPLAPGLDSSSILRMEMIFQDQALTAVGRQDPVLRIGWIFHDRG